MDVAVLTSDSESLSNVILEAMAAALPVVAYRSGGNPELINKERGALVVMGNESEFAGEVLNLLTHPGLREELGRNGRQFAQQNFGLDKVRNRYQELYESLLQKKGLRSSAQ
jgi:glycosyltransferase involved in cell wall biosynthesis